MIHRNPERTRERAERKKQERINTSTTRAGFFIYECTGGKPPERSPFRINIGSSPNGIEDESFMAQSVARALDLIRDRRQPFTLEYDHDASVEASPELNPELPTSGANAIHPGLRVVVNKVILDTPIAPAGSSPETTTY